MDLLTRVKIWYNKNRRIIISGLFFLLFLQICGRGGKIETKREPTGQRAIPERIEPDTLPNGEESLEQVFYEKIKASEAEPQPTFNPLFMEFLLMTVIVIIFYFVQKKGLLKNFLPARVSVKVRKRKDEQTGNIYLQLEIYNKTKDSVTFEHPVLTFKRYNKTRQFRIKGGDGQVIFPLTLTPDTGHKMLISINKFTEKIPELKKYNRIIVSIKADNGKNYVTKV